jgi:hypothetical protein
MEGFAHKLTSKFHSQSMQGKDLEESSVGEESSPDTNY